jgi:hypothetical protein
MAELKIKIKYHSFEIEMEGEEQTVIEQLENIKQGTLGNLTENIGKAEAYIKVGENKMIESKASSSNPVEILDSSGSDSYPTLKTLAIKNVCSAEPDWILLYAFYASEFGTKEFNKSEINKFYETSNRKTPQRIKNLSQNFNSLIKKDYLSSMNDNEYIITSQGLIEIKNIISGKKNLAVPKKKSSKEGSSPTTKKPSSTTKFNFKIVRDLNLKPKDKVSLIDFMSQYSFTSFTEKILGVVYYLKKELKLEKVSSDCIFTGLNELKERIPPSLKQLIINTRVKAWIDYDDYDDINVGIHGINHIEHDAKKVENE